MDKTKCQVNEGDLQRLIAYCGGMKADGSFEASHEALKAFTEIHKINYHRFIDYLITKYGFIELDCSDIGMHFYPYKVRENNGERNNSENR